jgi:chlorophyll synthase
VACIVMGLPQLAVVGLLLLWGEPYYAISVTLLLALQILLMTRLLRSPRELAPWYNGTGITLYVAGMLVSAFALRNAAGLAA